MRWTMSLLLGSLVAACGGPVEQGEACAAFVACVQARDEALGLATDTKRFDPGGGCWNGEEGAELCEAGCERGLAFLQESTDDLPEACLP